MGEAHIFSCDNVNVVTVNYDQLTIHITEYLSKFKFSWSVDPFEKNLGCLPVLN